MVWHGEVIQSIAAADAGDYTVTVENACGAVTSLAATVHVDEPRTILTPPASADVCEGEPVFFAATVNGTAPLEYQWQKDGVDLPGETSDTLSIAAATPADAGDYVLVITNGCGTESSAPATLTVEAAPAIVADPVDASLCVGESTTLTVDVSGSEPLTFQWLKDGQPVAGATEATLTLDNVTLADAGVYQVTVTNDCGDATSGFAAVDVLEAPAITADPVSQELCEGQPLDLFTTLTGTEPLTIEWTKDGLPLDGQTSATLSIAAVTMADAGEYQLTVTNDCGSATSAIATITVAEGPSATATSALTIDECTGETLTLTADVTGTEPLTLEWQKDGVTIPGAHDPSFTIAALTELDAGSYQLLVTNGCGFASTEHFEVTLVVAPEITLAPTGDDLLCADQGNSHTFTVEATGTEPLSYQWFKDGVALSGETDQTFTIFDIDEEDYGAYTVEVSNSCGADLSGDALLVEPAQGDCDIAFRRGDCNADSMIDLADSIFVMRFTFQSFAPPACMDPCDVNDDGVVDISDTIFSLNYIFANGAPPMAPTIDCGFDPSDDGLNCLDFNACVVQ